MEYRMNESARDGFGHDTTTVEVLEGIDLGGNFRRNGGPELPALSQSR
jgi:hypothetical protein